MMNVLDFAKWDIAITRGGCCVPESLKAMTTPVRLNDGRTVSHGLGWFMDRFNGHRFGAHWGTTVTGHSAVIRRYVDDGVTVIVLANLDDGGAWRRRDEQAHRRHVCAGRRHPGPDADRRCRSRQNRRG